MLLPGLYKQLITDPAAAKVLALLSDPTGAGSIFETVAVKGAVAPFLILNFFDALPASGSLDGISDLKDGEIQIDAYAATQPPARLLLNATRDYLMKTFVAGAFPDGTQITFVDVSLDRDMGYEQGDKSYVCRSLLRLKAFYTEGS